MNRFLSLIFILLSSVCAAQSNMSAPKNFYIAKEIKPPVLDVVEGSVKFIDQGGNNIIDASEACSIQFKVMNSGTGEGKGCIAKVTGVGATDGVKFSDEPIGTIPVGSVVDVSIPVATRHDTKDGNIEFTIQIYEDQGFGSEPFQLTVNTRKYEAPMLKIVDYTVTGAYTTTLKKRIPFDLQLLLQNTQYGKAEDVNVQLKLPGGVILLDGDMASVNISDMKGGEKQSLVYPLIAMSDYSASTIPVEVNIKEKYGKYSENRTVTLTINQHMSGSKIVIDSKEDQRQEIVIGTLGSKVDKDIPTTTQQNDKTFAVIIANENYQNSANVPYAMNDGGVFKDYCEKTLGIPAKNIHFVANATLNNIQGEVNWLENVLQSYEGQAKAIFYYAGHGIPDEASKDSYLLPVDGYGNNVRTGYKLQNLYASLGSKPSKSVTVFLDACFSGANRDGEMINPELRGVVIRANAAAPSGNMVVFSAAQGYETAMPYSEESHGLFTYYILKKLQETNGDVTYQDLSDYVQRNVRQQSSVMGKTQTPTVTPSTTIGDGWKSWTLK